MSRFLRLPVALALLAAIWTLADAPISQAEEATTPERAQVGQSAPEFTLADPDGKDHSTAELRGEKNLLVVFFRGAW